MKTGRRRLAVAGTFGAAAVAAALALPVAGGAEPPPQAAAAGDDVSLRRIGTFAQPMLVAHARGDARRLFVVERAGRVRLVRSGRKLRRPFLDIRGLTTTDGERGLLSLAFAPDYATSRRFYVFYTANSGDLTVAEFKRSTRSRDYAVRSSRRTVLTQRHRRFSNHNGGHIAFGPDGRLFISTGDGGGGGDPGENAQDLRSRLGKLLRIDPRASRTRSFRVPADNPFRNRAGARPEIWAYGLRNPFRYSFDRLTGDLALGDVGQNQIEEIDFAERSEGLGRGANYGWDVWEGTRRFEPGTAPGHVPPVLELLHGHGYCSVIGGVVVRDERLPALNGRYVFGDLCRSGLQQARLDTRNPRATALDGAAVDTLVGFGEDARGRVHAVSLEGPVYRLDPPAP